MLLFVGDLIWFIKFSFCCIADLQFKMEAILEMRKDAVELKAELEEKLGEEDETKTLVLQLAQATLKKTTNKW